MKAKTIVGVLVFVPVVVVVGVIVLLAGVIVARHLHKEYAYRTVEHDCGWGVVTAKLTGSAAMCGDETVRGSPYGLTVVFHCPDGEGTVTLNRLELRDAAQRGRLCAEIGELTRALRPVRTGDYEAYYGLSGLGLDYVPYVLRVRFTVQKGEATESGEIELLFERDYREYRSEETLLDVYMGV